MTVASLDLDLEITPAALPRPEELAADPDVARAAALCSLTSPTINTYAVGVGRCPTCC